MNEAALARGAWENFYVIVGSSAGALTGLQFVVLTLVAESGSMRNTSGESISAFGSPNVVHFCAALFVSALFSAPWAGLEPPGLAAAVLGTLGVAYTFEVLRRALRQREYRPVLEDWIWHAVLPLLAYAALVAAGLALRHASALALYVVAAAALLLVFIGIHNAWDTVMYITLETAARRRSAHLATPRPADRSASGATPAPPRRPDL